MLPLLQVQNNNGGKTCPSATKSSCLCGCLNSWRFCSNSDVEGPISESISSPFSISTKINPNKQNQQLADEDEAIIVIVYGISGTHHRPLFLKKPVRVRNWSLSTSSSSGSHRDGYYDVSQHDNVPLRDDDDVPIIITLSIHGTGCTATAAISNRDEQQWQQQQQRLSQSYTPFAHHVGHRLHATRSCRICHQ